MSTPREPSGADPRLPLPPELDPRQGRPRRGGSGRPGAAAGGSGGSGHGGVPWTGPTRVAPGPSDGNLLRRGSGGRPPDGRPPGWPPGRGEPGPPATGRGRLARVAKVLAAALSVLVLLASGYLWFVYRDFNGKVGRVNAIPRSTVSDVDGKDQNILLVGSDDRSTATRQELAALGTEMDPGKNTDTMILVHVPADGRRATAVSFPRDSWVKIPGFGMGKLNSAYADGAYGAGGTPNPDRGRQLLVRTISELSGIRIDHYVEVDLLGFYRITRAVGGVEVCLKAPQKEKDSGINLPAGRQTIEGKQALAFVRQRKGLPHGDLDRIVRQQYFLAATFRKMKSAGVIGNPVKLKRLLDAVGTSMRMDASLDPLQLARQVRGLADGNVEFRTVPNKGGAKVAGRDVVLLDTEALPAFFESMTRASAGSAKPAKTVPRSEVSVQVYNGSGTRGLAGTTATALRSAGFTVTGTSNADRSDYPRTVIRYAPDNEAQASTLAAAVPGADLQKQDGAGAGVQLILGRDFTGLSSGSPAAGRSSGSGTGGARAASPSSASSARTAADAGCIN